MNIEHISISRDSVWSQCKESYKFRYHLQVVSPEPTPIYFTFGKLVHRAIEEFTLSKGEKDIFKIAKDIIDGKIDLDPGTKCPYIETAHKSRLTRHLKNFLRLNSNIGTEGIVEWKFKYDLDPPHKRYMTGLIDRLIKKDDQFFIVDYKTTKAGNWRKDFRTITSDLQLQCYCYVVMREFNAKPKNIQAALYYLEDSKLVPVRFSEKTLLKVPERLLKVYKDIEIAHPDHVIGNVGEWCKRCEWRKQCKFYALT